MKTDVLVIGAGPAGSAAAIALARRGISVALVDRQSFPRDKVCGDALIPDALGALRQLGLRSRLADRHRWVDELRIYAPDGTSVSLSGEFASLPRRSLDAVLLEAALEAGAEFVSPFRVAGPRTTADRVSGARFDRVRGGDRLEIEAGITLLATGASSGPLEMFGVCRRRSPSAIAARAYFRAPDDFASTADHLCISYDRAICPGYGWVFPGPEGLFNLGVGTFCGSRRTPTMTQIRSLWSTFIERVPLARRVVQEGEQVGRLRGAPLRTAMTGAHFHRPGLLVLGEAAGTTYPFTGEGIGKAMESGMLAAEIVADSVREGRSHDAEIGALYADTLRARYGQRFRSYRIAQSWLSWPAICNLVSRRARSNGHVRRQLEGMITERTDPGAVLSFSGILRAVFR